MRPTPILTLLGCALAGAALAQQPAPPAIPEAPQAAQVETEAGHESPPGKELLPVRVRRLLDDFDQRHQQRVLEMSSYAKVGNAEPGVKQFADPRKVEVELKDEQDREQTSEALAKEYTEESQQVQNQEQALQDFVAKRQKTLDDLSKRASAINRQDLEAGGREPGSPTRDRGAGKRNPPPVVGSRTQRPGAVFPTITEPARGGQRGRRAEEAPRARAVARERVQSLHGRRCLGPSEPVAFGRPA